MKKARHFAAAGLFVFLFVVPRVGEEVITMLEFYKTIQ